MKTYECQVCYWTYSEEYGVPQLDITAGTKFEDLPSDWTCPKCESGKDEFKVIEE